MRLLEEKEKQNDRQAAKGRSGVSFTQCWGLYANKSVNRSVLCRTEYLGSYPRFRLSLRIYYNAIARDTHVRLDNFVGHGVEALQT